MLVGAVGPLFFNLFDPSDAYLITALGLGAHIGAAAFMLICGAAAFAAGYVFFTPRPPGGAQQPINPTVTLAIWLGAFLFILVLLGPSPGAMVMHARLLMSKVRGVLPAQPLIFFLLVIVTVQCTVFAISVMQAPTRRRVGIAALILVLTTVLSFAVGSRMSAAFTLLAPAIYFGTRRRLQPAMIALAGAAAIAIVYVGDLIRRAAQGRDIREADGALSTFFSSYSLLDPMAVAIELRQRLPHSAFESIHIIVYSLLPKAMVGERPLYASLAARYIFYGDTLGGVTLGMFGEYVYYFGFIAMLVLSVLTGALVRFLATAAAGTGLAAAFAFVACLQILFSVLRDGLFIDLIGLVELAILFAVQGGWRMAITTHAPVAVRTPAGQWRTPK